MHSRERLPADFAFRVYLGAVACVVFSIAAGQALAVLAAILTVVQSCRTAGRRRLPWIFWPALAFCAVAVLSSALGIDPARALPRTRRLLWFAVLLVGAWHVTDVRRMRQVVGALVAGSCLLAAEVCFVHPWQAWRAVQAHPGGPDFLTRLIDLGGMTDGQMLMLGLVGCVAFGFERSRSPWRAGALALAGLGIAVALVLNFKRGSWICAAGMVGVLVLRRAGWRAVAVLGLVVALALVSPWVRHRLHGLGGEMRLDSGGRATMWFRIAPALVREHPFGIGYGAMTNDLMRRYARNVEPGRNHLHSNIAELAVSTGWPGLALYLVWMVWAVRDAAVRLRRLPPDDTGGRTLALAVLIMLLGLLANGLVEYNLGDSELVLVYAALMGMGVRLAHAAGSPGEGHSASLPGAPADGQAL